VIEERARARVKTLCSRPIATIMECQENTRITKNICRKKKREWERENLEGVEEFAEKNDVRQLYTKMGQIKKGFQP
jgi:hypothetical protein